MYFLIDFENVRNNGMRGTEHLLPDDHVILFYSSAALTIEARYLEDIERSGCAFSACRLITPRKNALDFYIAARLGELYGSGYEGKSVLISKDNGCKSLREYFTQCVSLARGVYQAENIERGIVSANDAHHRAQLIRDRTRQTSIEAYYAAYRESLRRRKFLEELFSDTEYAGHVDALEELLKGNPPAKRLYPAILHRFGRSDGLSIYRMLKTADPSAEKPD